MAVTIADVAKHAGVARSTVSYVLSGNRSISPETIERVQRSIRELGFRPHAGAQSIRTRRSGIVAMVLPMVHGPHNQVQMPYVWSAMTTAQEAGLKLLMLNDDDGEAAIRDAVATALVDGVMLMEVQAADPRVALLKELGCPAVIVGTPDEPHGIPCVDFDFDQGARDCVGHLIGLGHRRIGYLGQPQETYELGVAYATHARDAMLSALAEHGCDAAWTPCATDRDPVADALDDLYAALPGMTALIVYNEGAVPLVLDRLTALGLEVPGDISVIGLCPDDEAERCRPPLTSVTLPAEHLAATAVRDLARRVKGEELSPRTLLSPELKPRSSTAPARS